MENKKLKTPKSKILHMKTAQYYYTIALLTTSIIIFVGFLRIFCVSACLCTAVLGGLVTDMNRRTDMTMPSSSNGRDIHSIHQVHDIHYFYHAHFFIKIILVLNHGFMNTTAYTAVATGSASEC
jgi:hypothetical protein